MENQEIKLEDLIPQNSSFELAQFPDFKFQLKPCTGGMLIDISRKLGASVETLLSQHSLEGICKISIILMEFESAKKFKTQEVKTIDVMTGEEDTLKIGGYKLMSHCISGIDEQFAIYSAILMSMGYTKKKAQGLIKKIKDEMNGVVNSEIEKAFPKKKTKKK